MSNTLLQIDNVTVRFGGLVALDRVAIDVAEGTIHAVIGPNGAGKSTLLNVVTGIHRPTQGSVKFKGQATDRCSPHAINGFGIARTFQNTELFGEMSALENVMVGLDRFHANNILSGALHDRLWAKADTSARLEARKLLDLVGLGEDEESAAASLPFGKQRRLEIARALATRPSLLLLDEPAAGLRAAEIEVLNQILLDLRGNHKITILLIDHVMTLVMAISDRISVINFGRKIADGTAEQVRHSPDVIKAYLGEKAADAFDS